MTKHEAKVNEAVARLMALRKSLPPTMVPTADKRVLAQYSVRVAVEALQIVAKATEGRER